MLTGDLRESHKLQWVLLVLMLLVVAAALLVMQGIERQSIEVREREHLAGQVRVIEQNMDRQIAATRAALGSVLSDWVFFSSLPSGHELSNLRLQSLSEAMPGIRTMLILTPQGLVLSSNRAELIGRDFAERDYVRAVLLHPDPDTLYVSQPFRTVLDVYALNMTRVSLWPDGRPLNIVSATLDPDFFGILMESIRYAPDMWVAMAHGDGVLFNHVPPREELLGADLARPGSLFTRHMESGEEATVFEGVAATTGESILMAQRTIAPPELQMDKPLVVAVARSRQAVFAGWTQKTIALAALWCVLVLVSVGSMAFYQRRQRHLIGIIMEEEASRQRAEEEVRQLAFNDPLTGLPNRRLLLDRMRQLQAASLRRGRLSALLYVDLDHFKALNDHLGHDRGDEFLRRLAQHMLACVRDEDTVARLGGDEFVVMLSVLSSQADEAVQQASVVAEKILHLVRADPLAVRVEPHCSASIGITLFGNRAEAVEEILKRADIAMYRVKMAGRDGVEILDAGSSTYSASHTGAMSDTGVPPPGAA
ncbi:MAG TPA: sensor domain-containing diguanylate cyclase [Azoarcus taiwanensis]|uniref:Diguanylate cyclase n=1 Tax=Azoarcus taiwanensis TaxID=666964 RepID=A0A972FBB2_9RHOO|nr:diguanylate cyclase [Azoarcus taiwanensis]HRQ59259.1 sensor domain-containing diguanylate cyclase [Azoarcus taiwanensis]